MASRRTGGPRLHGQSFDELIDQIWEEVHAIEERRRQNEVRLAEIRLQIRRAKAEERINTYRDRQTEAYVKAHLEYRHLAERLINTGCLSCPPRRSPEFATVVRSRSLLPSAPVEPLIPPPPPPPPPHDGPSRPRPGGGCDPRKPGGD